MIPKLGSPTFERAVVNIDWPFGQVPPALHCPITGVVVLSGYGGSRGPNADYDLEEEWDDVPTLRFIYIDGIGEFDYIHPSLEAVIEQKRNELEAAGRDAEFNDDFDILADHVEELGEVPLIYELTTRGMGCGPVSRTIWVGFDLFAAHRDGEDDDHEQEEE